MNRVYSSDFAISLNDGAPTRRVEIRNPTNSGVDLELLRISDAGTAGLVEYEFVRYTSLATHGAGGDAPEEAMLYNWDPADPAPSFEVWFTEAADPSAQIVWPSDGNIDLRRVYNQVSGDSGDDAEFDVGKYRRPNEQIVIPPGCSASIRYPLGQADYRPSIEIKEVPHLPAAHIASAALPGAGAYTTATAFRVPFEWTSVTAWLTYTAHGSSTTARPRWRASVSPDGTNWYPLPVVDQTPDTATSPEARRDVYQHADVWKTVVAASATIRVPISFDIPPGAPFVRLDVAEHGETANPGTAAVYLTGA